MGPMGQMGLMGGHLEDDDDDEYENDRAFARYLLDDAPDSTAKGRRDIASRTIFRT